MTRGIQLNLFADEQPADFMDAVVGLLRRLGYAPVVHRVDDCVRIVANRPAQPKQRRKLKRRL